MMKVKTQTKKELDLVLDYMTRLGVGHTVKGFTVETPDVADSLKRDFYSLVELNTGYSVRHLDWS